MINSLYNRTTEVTREKSLDLLRTLACIMVIVVHVTSPYVSKSSSPSFQFTIGNIYHSLSCCCVPIFVLISGYFLLSNAKNKDYHFFYKKTIDKIVIPTASWSFIYFFYSYLMLFLALDSGKAIDVFAPIKSLILGEPYYHLWYLYMVIALYLVTPFIISVKENFSKRTFLLITLFLLINGSVIQMFNIYEGQTLFWTIKFIPFLGYFMLGSVLHDVKDKLKPRASLWGILSVLLGCFVVIIAELIVDRGVPVNIDFIYSSLNPLVILYTISVFIALYNVRLKTNLFSTISKYTFHIYVIHAVVNSWLSSFLGDLSMQFNGVWFIPVKVVVVFTISLLFAFFIKRTKCKYI